MKRSIAFAEPENEESGRDKSYRRQEPVSCEFCRKKKLKCDRGAPCSNCNARKIACSSSADVPLLVEQRPPEQAAKSNQTINELNARLQKLEELLGTRAPALSNHLLISCPNISQSIRPKSKLPEEVELSNKISWIETDAFEHEPSFPDHNFASDAKVAENFGAFIFSLTRPRIADPIDPSTLAMLPSRTQGESLLDFFFQNINWLYHIVHVPTVKRHFNTLYSSLEQNRQPEYGHLALISTIFALSAYFSSPTSGLYFKDNEAMPYCRCWTLIAQDALSASNSLSKPTIETLQSFILITQHLMANMGAIATLRTSAATVISTARALGLHLTDSAANKRQREKGNVDWVDVEVRRRMWWHIVSTDWLLSFMSGPQCGTYMIQEVQMNVDYPSNVDDEAISNHGQYAQPPHIPTDMTYLIARTKCSKVFREIVDSSWTSGCNLDELPYDLVLSFDKKLNLLMGEFEKVFQQLSNNSPTSYLSGVAKTQEQKLAIIARQRSMAYFGVYTRFSRLHRPYLIRGAIDPQYAYSRMVCLRSARMVLELGQKMNIAEKGLTSMKIWSINHHMFVSTVILVMDYCFNREEPRAKERKEEILDCFRLLEGNKEESTIASRGLQKLRNMLRDDSPGKVHPGATPHQEQARNIQPALSHNTVTSQDSFSQAPSAQFTSNFIGSDLVVQSQYNFTYPEDFNFDANMDPSLFEELFMNLESNDNQFF